MTFRGLSPPPPRQRMPHSMASSMMAGTCSAGRSWSCTVSQVVSFRRRTPYFSTVSARKESRSGVRRPPGILSRSICLVWSRWA